MRQNVRRVIVIRRFLPLLLLPAAALAQPTLDGEAARIFRFAHAELPQQRQEIVNAIRSITEMQRTVVDSRAGALAVRGTPEQLELAAWVFGELDRAPAPPASTVMDSHQVPGDYAPQARAFFLSHGGNPETIQEIVNAVRAVAEVQRMAAYNANSALVLRGTADQMQLAAWIIRNLDKPSGVQSDAKPLEYTYNDSSPRPTTAVRMYRLAHSTTPQAMQELVNAIRSISEAQRVMVNNAVATITLRGTPAQAAMATWLVEELDRGPAAPKEPKEK
jgi:type II secretory pathway component GspD/PulD (secretin)